MDSLTFEGVAFTDKVLLGQASYSNNYSQCSNITFRDCSFDLQNSAEKLKDAITHKGGGVRGDIAAAEKLAYLNGFVLENCSFRNVRYAFWSTNIRNAAIRGCEMEQCSGYAIRLDDVAGQLTVENNRVTGAEGVLSINTVGNNYSTTDIVTDVAETATSSAPASTTPAPPENPPTPFPVTPAPIQPISKSPSSAFASSRPTVPAKPNISPTTEQFENHRPSGDSFFLSSS